MKRDTLRDYVFFLLGCVAMAALILADILGGC